MTAPKRPVGRPKSSAPPRTTISMRISETAYLYYVREAGRRSALEPHRGKPVGHTEVMREVLENAAAKTER